MAEIGYNIPVRSEEINERLLNLMMFTKNNDKKILENFLIEQKTTSL